MDNFMDTMGPRLKDALDIAEKLGASAAAISCYRGTSTDISFESNRLKSCGMDESAGYSISLVINGRTGGSAGNIPEAMPDMVRRAAAFAKNGAVSHFDCYPKPAANYPEIKFYSPTVKQLTVPQLIDDCQSLIDGFLTLDSELVCGAGAGISENECLIMNSGGLCQSYSTTHWGLSAGCQKTTGTDMLFSHAGRGWGEVNHLYDLNGIYKEIEFDLMNSRKIAPVQSGIYPLLIPPKLLNQFLSPVYMGINGRSVFKGTSPLKDKLGTACFSSALSITDMPHVDFSFSSAAFDDAGTPTAERQLIYNGTLNCFLYDYDTAAMAKTETTANTGCSPYNPRVIPGNVSSSELLKSIKRGIYVKKMLGFGQTNLANGDFSANLALGFLVENGEITGRVKDVMIAGNVFSLLTGDISFSSDVHPQNHQPFALIPDVQVRA